MPLFAMALVLSLLGRDAVSGDPVAAAPKPTGSDDNVIAIYVFAGDPSTGFVDPDLKASARHLTEEIRKRKLLRIVDDAARADVRVQIKRRSKRTEAGYAVGNVVFPVEEMVIEATLSAGDYNTEVSGSGSRMTRDGSWKQGAKKLAESVEKWIVENRPLLVSRRDAKASSSPGPR